VLEAGGGRTATVVAVTPLRAIVLTAQVMRDVREQMSAVGERIDHAAREHRERDEQRRV